MATAKLHGTEVPEGGDEEKRRPSSRSRCIAPLRNLSSGKCILGKSCKGIGLPFMHGSINCATGGALYKKVCFETSPR